MKNTLLSARVVEALGRKGFINGGVGERNVRSGELGVGNGIVMLGEIGGETFVRGKR